MVLGVRGVGDEEAAEYLDLDNVFYGWITDINGYIIWNDWRRYTSGAGRRDGLIPCIVI